MVIHKSNDYRPEIDGLRAVAVLLVLFNHAGYSLFSGGYLGVDVFFVLSGFLITSIIVREIETDGFSYLSFIERRVRRLLPALFAMLLPVTILASVILIGDDRKSYFRSLFAVSTFWSNIRFYLDIGYFDVSAAYKPLLHTWSLGIEEQFYIIFPILLAAFRWRTGRRFISFVSLLTALSLWSVAISTSSTAFYLLPSRAWELLTGVLAALLSSRFRFKPGDAQCLRFFTSFMTLSVLIVILVTAMSIDDKTRWPWSTTLIPVLGTAVLLVFLTPGTLTYQMLSVRPLVRVGLWSYSTYLWHYPIFSLVRYSTDSYSPILLVSLSLFLGWLSWRFIETPFRDRQKFNRRTILSVAAVSCVLLSSTGLIAGGLTTKGATANLSDKAGAPLPVMLIGDSHADHLLSGLSVTLGNQLSARTSPGCVPLWNVDRYDYRFKRGDCAKFATAAINEAVRSPAVRTVVLASMGPVYLTGTTFHGFDPDRVTDDGLVLVSEPEIADRWRVFETGLRNTFHRLERAGKKTIFVIDVPELGIEPQRCDLDNPRSCQNPVAEVDRRSLRYRELVKEVAKEFASVSVFDPTQLFCNNTRCTGIRKGERLYRDVDHLSDAGSALVAEFLTPIIFDSIGNRDES